MWKALTEPEHLEHWWGPKGFTSRVHTLELRPGGTFLDRQRRTEGREMWGKWVYREIVAPERLVIVSSLLPMKGQPGPTPVRAELAARDTGHIDVHRASRPHNADSTNGPDKRDRIRAADFLRRVQFYGRRICRHIRQARRVPRNALRPHHQLTKGENDATESLSDLQRQLRRRVQVL